MNQGAWSKQIVADQRSAVTADEVPILDNNSVSKSGMRKNAQKLRFQT